MDNKNFHLYDHDQPFPFLELSDRHVLWDINTQGNKFDVEHWNLTVEFYAKNFEENFQTELLLLGRSGRHVCVDDNEENRERYNEMVEYIKELQKLLIQEVNAYYSVKKEDK